jgi:hypothetical protein
MPRTLPTRGGADRGTGWRVRERRAYSPRGASPARLPGARPLACLRANFGDTPKIQVRSARFVAEHEVELTLENGSTWRTSFDPDTLRPSQTFDADCGHTGAHVYKATP